MPDVNFVATELPQIDVPTAVPELGRDVFERRFRRLEDARKAAGLDRLLIYADREHAANLSWLTGFAPRFEEALWIQGDGRPTLLVGNECLSLARAQVELDADIVLYQPFSLPGQDRSVSTDLRALLRNAGLESGMRCGAAGWKPMDVTELPHWIVAAVADVVGDAPSNANDLLMDPDTGLRATLEPEAICFFEYAQALVSEAVKAWVLGLREGTSERDSARFLQSYGLELSCHPMVNFGHAIPSGLKSPRNAVAERGMYAQVALGVIGGLSSRAGRLMTSQDEAADDYLDLVENYLQVVRTWYQAVDVGASAGEAVAAAVGAKDETWDFALNPGHLISLDEWLGSPFVDGSSSTLRSGQAIQADIIPMPRRGDAALNMEDGFVLADGDLQEELQRLDPALMRRCGARRAFMESLGYELAPSILPLSNIPGVFFPFLLEPRYVVRFS